MAPPEGGSAEAPRDFAAELEESAGRLTEAERYLGLDRLTARRAGLESEAARPDLWDDSDQAVAITSELGRVTADLEQLTALRTELNDANALQELVEEARGEGAPDAPLEKELVETVDGLRSRLSTLELQSLFSGEYDERDAVVEVHAGAGGTDAQDWTEMMLRMYQRWAERRGFSCLLYTSRRGPPYRGRTGRTEECARCVGWGCGQCRSCLLYTSRCV